MSKELKEKEFKKEKLVLAEISKEDGKIGMEVNKSANTFELLGFLKCYVEALEEDLINSFEFDEGFKLY